MKTTTAHSRDKRELFSTAILRLPSTHFQAGEYVKLCARRKVGGFWIFTCAAHGHTEDLSEFFLHGFCL